LTNQDKKDSIRGRMADTGESFNAARRKVEAAAAGRVPEGQDPYQLIEVEVGSDLGTGTGSGRGARRHIEAFWGRWILAPDPQNTRTAIRPDVGRGPEGAYYGVAQTRRGRIAVYWGFDGLDLPVGELNDYDTLDDAQLPADIRRQVDAALGIREVIQRDI
jgi:hypothetical protein